MNSRTAIFAILAALSGGAAPPNEAIEPPVTYTVVIDGKSHDIKLNDALKIEGQFTNPEIKITASSTRTFPYAGLSFAYPAGFSWGADLTEPEAKKWTMNGDDCIIMVFAFGEKIDPNNFALLMAQKFHTDKSAVTPITRKLNNAEIKGYRVPIKLVDTRLVQEIYDLSSKTDSRMLIIQDTPPGIAARSKEAVEVYEYLDKTLTFTK